MDNLTIDFRKIENYGNITLFYKLICGYESPFIFYSDNQLSNIPDMIEYKGNVLSRNRLNNNNSFTYNKHSNIIMGNLAWTNIYIDFPISPLIDHGNNIKSYMCLKICPKTFVDLFLFEQIADNCEITINSVMFCVNNNNHQINIAQVHNEYLKMNKKFLYKTINDFIRKILMTNCTVKNIKTNNRDEFNERLIAFSNNLIYKDNKEYNIVFNLQVLSADVFIKLFSKFRNDGNKFIFRRYLICKNYHIIYPTNKDIDGKQIANIYEFDYECVNTIQTFNIENMDSSISVYVEETTFIDNEVSISTNLPGTIVYEIKSDNITFTVNKTVDKIDNINDEFKLSLNDFIKLANFYSVQYHYMIKKDNVPNINFEFTYMNFVKVDYYYILHKIQTNINRRGHNPKELCIMPITLDKINYTDIYKKINYFISSKTDGIHALMYFEIIGDDIQIEIISDTQEYVYEFKCDNCKGNGKYIIEGELYGEDLKSFIVFDVLMYESKQTYLEFSKNRISLINNSVKLLNDIGFKCIAKEWVYIESNFNTSEIMKSYNFVINADVEYENDGIILMTNQPYHSCEVYKWKPIEQLTIDFYVKKIHQFDNNKCLYWLMCGMSDKDYVRFNRKSPPEYITKINRQGKKTFPFPFMPADNPSVYKYICEYSKLGDGDKIVEFNYINGQFNITRIRTDRQINLDTGTYYGNYWRIAELNWLSIINPLKLENLWNFDEVEGERYFHEKENIYEAQTKYSKRAKGYIMSLPFNSSNNICLDIGFGKGQDIYRYSNMRTRELFVVEPDKDAIMYGRRSYLNWFLMDNTEHSRLPNLHAINLDIKNIDSVITQISNMIEVTFGFDAPKNIINKIIMNFSVHYYVDKISDIINKLKPFVANKGRIISVFLNGSKVFKKLENQNEYNIVENRTVKYRIVKRYNQRELIDVGQMIDLKLPFSGDEMYSEQLVNPRYLNSEISGCGFTLIESKSIKYDDLYKIIKSNAHNERSFEYLSSANNNMSEADKLWVELYSFAIWEKNN